MIRKTLAVAAATLVLVAGVTNAGAAAAADGAGAKARDHLGVAKRGKLTSSLAIGFNVSNTGCYRSGGYFGHGYVTGKVKQTEYGSGVDRFRQAVQAQYYSNGAWLNDLAYGQTTSSKFPDDSRNFYWEVTWTVSWSSQTVGKDKRVWVRADWLKNDAIVTTQHGYLNCSA